MDNKVIVSLPIRMIRNNQERHQEIEIDLSYNHKQNQIHIIVFLVKNKQRIKQVYKVLCAKCSKYTVNSEKEKFDLKVFYVVNHYVLLGFELIDSNTKLLFNEFTKTNQAQLPASATKKNIKKEKSNNIQPHIQTPPLSATPMSYEVEMLRMKLLNEIVQR